MVKKSMIEQPCETCSMAKIGLALAANQTAVNCVIEAYRNHLVAAPRTKPDGGDGPGRNAEDGRT